MRACGGDAHDRACYGVYLEDEMSEQLGFMVTLTLGGYTARNYQVLDGELDRSSMKMRTAECSGCVCKK